MGGVETKSGGGRGLSVECVAFARGNEPRRREGKSPRRCVEMWRGGARGGGSKVWLGIRVRGGGGGLRREGLRVH